MYTVPVDKVIFSVVDIETTGLYPYLGDRICEIGAVRFTLSSKLAEFSTLVNPGIPMSRTARYINGITDKMVKEAPSISDVKDRFLSFIGNTVLVFHNAPFDLSFLIKEMNSRIDNLVLDTLTIARRRFNFRYNTLEYIARTLSVKSLPTHRAIDDARALSEITKVFINTLKPHMLGDILVMQGGSVEITGKFKN
jgi:DNA polymerase III epsilon subunit family exonuclease